MLWLEVLNLVLGTEWVALICDSGALIFGNVFEVKKSHGQAERTKQIWSRTSCFYINCFENNVILVSVQYL